MSKTTINTQILEALANLNKRLDTIDERLTTLENGKSKPTTSAKGKAEKTVKLFSVDIKDYEPKKDESGNYIWQSYKKNRTRFCYAVATEGKAYGCYDKDGNKICEFADIEKAYNKAKDDFSKKYTYIKKADR